MYKTAPAYSVLISLLLTLPVAAYAQDKSPTSEAPAPAAAAPNVSASFDKALNPEGNWYFSWGYSRQQYAPSDIHVSQPGLGNDFTVHQARASDFPSSVQDTLSSLINLDLTNPQENLRIGKFMNPEKTFAIEFSLDHSKYNVDLGQTVGVSGTINGAPANPNMVVDAQNFNYALHNGLNHVMVNAVWLKHLHGPENAAGDLQLISRLGAGVLIPHADNTILGKQNEVGPKNENVCCFSSKDWWQINGWTTGVEVGVRYRVYKSMFIELTGKLAYGVLKNVPVYQGVADQKIWMSEQVLSAGFLF
ncbi:hypothetical protein [Rhodoferax aquaticus]|uniref:Outer membrane protein beta-barrel domain-containing protein n=1 Tax=Rhodoferax aquaticus TaxID=2527691 RepID=A0A515ESE2_9BURK|nr:hypothetical protein [Rhodoferax aquaticus]QDL55574.1 hypothetical protein EXZ61_16090 [Rhodoferax aquaticus]